MRFGAAYSCSDRGMMPSPVFRKVDCVQIPVTDLEQGLAFYRDRLGHKLIWRTESAAGLALSESDTELVIQTEPQPLETDFLVSSADEAATTIREAGGHIMVEPFDIPIGRCVVVQDPWDNRLTLLDTSKGLLVTDRDGIVLLNPDGTPRVERGAL